MAVTTNIPGTVYATPTLDHPVREWTQQELDEFRAGWDTLSEERKAFSRAQAVLYATTPEGLLNIRTNEIVEKIPAKPEPEPEQDEEDVKTRTANRAKKTRS